MLGVKSLMIWWATMVAATSAIVCTDGVWWAIAIAWVTICGGAWMQRAATRGYKLRADRTASAAAVRAYWDRA